MTLYQKAEPPEKKTAAETEVSIGQTVWFAVDEDGRRVQNGILEDVINDEYLQIRCGNRVITRKKHQVYPDLLSVAEGKAGLEEWKANRKAEREENRGKIQDKDGLIRFLYDEYMKTEAPNPAVFLLAREKAAEYGMDL